MYLPASFYSAKSFKKTLSTVKEALKDSSVFAPVRTDLPRGFSCDGDRRGTADDISPAAGCLAPGNSRGAENRGVVGFGHCSLNLAFLILQLPGFAR